MKRIAIAVVMVLGIAPLSLAADPPARSAKEALQAFNDLIGPWRGTGEPEGTRAEKQKGFWTETQAWEWQFKGDDVWLKVVVEKGKYFTLGELRYLPKKDQYQLSLTTTDKQTLVFEGPLADKKLTLDRVDESAKETQRFVLSFLHSNRFLFAYHTKKDGRPDFTKVYTVGVTRSDMPFAGGDTKPECVVSGGLGTMMVMYKGEKYFVCCSGCRDAFIDNPEKYIKEFNERKAKEKMK